MQTVDWFDRLLRYTARKYSRLGYSGEDFYQDLVMAVSGHDWIELPTLCRVLHKVLPISPAHVNRFVACTASNLARAERRVRKGRRVWNDSFDWPTATLPPDDEEASVLLSELQNVLDERDYEIVVAKLRIARNSRPVDSSVAIVLAISPATVSRAMSRARARVSEILHERNHHDRNSFDHNSRISATQPHHSVIPRLPAGHKRSGTVGVHQNQERKKLADRA